MEPTEPQVAMKLCPECQGERLKEDEDGIPTNCKTCSGMGEVCDCCGKKRYLCRKLTEFHDG